MTNPMLIWYTIVGIVLVACVADLLFYIRSNRHESSRRLLEMGKDNDIFFIPGDCRIQENDYADED